MLKTTPSIDYKPTAKATSPKAPLPCKVSFYADCPDGQRNKRFNYKVHDLNHAIDLMDRFKEKGFIVRSAYFTKPNGSNIRLPL